MGADDELGLAESVGRKEDDGTVDGGIDVVGWKDGTEDGTVDGEADVVGWKDGTDDGRVDGMRSSHMSTAQYPQSL